MDNKEFFIYCDRNLLQLPSTTEYRVERLLCVNELKPSIKSCKQELDLEGAQSIFKNFDKLFSLVELIDQFEYCDLHYVYEEILVKNLNIIGSFFSSYGNIEDIPLDLCRQYINIIKMSIYLFVEFVLSFNKKIEADYSLLLLDTKGRNMMQGIIQKHTSEYDWNWEDKLCDGFKAIYSIILNNITLLYDPPYIDHTLVSYIASCCYTQLENASIAFVRSTSLRDSIMQILIILITDYDHTNDFKIEIVKLMKQYEHLSIHLAKIVMQVIESRKNCSSLIELIVKEIALKGELEGMKDSSHQNTTGGKSYCVFLVEIAKHYPQLLIQNIEHLLPCLECDPYTMRICVLSVLKELIIHVLNNDELDELGQKTRDSYLLIIKDHFLDVNAFVRSKALQLFIVVAKENCLPKNIYKIILNSAEDKLHDKSSYVRKSAIQLIETLIKLNPYSFDFTEKTLEDKLEKQNCILKSLEQVFEEKINTKINKEKMWSSIESPLKLFLDKNFENNDLESFDEPELFRDKEFFDVLINIKKNINVHKFNVALKLVLHGKKTFSEEPLFKIQEENDLSTQLFLLMKNIWWFKCTTSNVSVNMKDFEHLSAEELNEKISSVESKILYLEDCIEYLNIIKKSLKTVSQLMFENTSSVSIEAINFLTTAFQFNISHSQTRIDDMLALIYSSDVNIKKAMMNSYKTIYLSVNESIDVNKRAITAMTRLINLIKRLNVTNRKAFKVLLIEWINNEILDNDCIMLLWAWFKKSIIISHEDRLIVALLLSFLACAKPSIANDNLDNLIEHGLCNDYQLFIYTCQILVTIAQEDFIRFPINGNLINRILSVTQKCFIDEGNINIFNNVATNAINTIYKLTIKPDVTCTKLIVQFYNFMKNNKIVNNSTMQKDKTIEVNSILLAKLIFIVGHIAIQQYNHLENYVAKELIRRVRNKYEVKKSKMDTNMKEECIHDYEGAKIEAINVRIQNLCNKKLITGNGILSLFTDHVIKSCSSNSSDLKANAVITLIKFMMISDSFCKTNLQLFVDLLENADDPGTRIDLISGFGSLIFRHPNILEPSTDKLYGRLNDKCNEVRYSALMIIIALIRQEMIKVRSQVAGIAKLLVDEDEKIKYTAKEFFRGIAENGNSLYNVLSDIISILSNPEDIVSENNFQTIITFLFPLITKERQIEALVDKLCMRLKASCNGIQEYYISYCLMVIKYTDKSLIKLSENISHYSNKLNNPKVYINFMTLITNNSKMAKSAIKEILMELSTKIEKIVENEGFDVPQFNKTPGKCLKNQAKSTIKKCNKNEMEPLQADTSRSVRTRNKVKRRLIETNEKSESDDEISLFKQTKRQNKFENSILSKINNEQLEECIENMTTPPLQTQSKQFVKNGSKVKCIQKLKNSDKEENNDEFDHKSSVGNIQKSVYIDKKCVDAKINKRTTRRNK